MRYAMKVVLLLVMPVLAQPVKIIFDTDMGSDCDDAGALALLHQYAARGEAEILATVYSSGAVPYGAGVVQAINQYYGRNDVPVGAVHNEAVGDSVDKMTAEKLAKDTAAYGNIIIHNQDAPELTRLVRGVLARQPHRSVTYVTVGHTKGLYDVLVSRPDSLSPLSGEALLEQKVARWVALGALGARNPEGHFRRDWNFFFNGTAFCTAYLVKHFPAKIIYIDAGHDVLTGKSLKQTPSGNIVRTAYRDWLWNVFEQTLDDQRPSWDLAAVYYAVKGTGRFLEDTGAGWLEFDPETGSRWHADSSRTRQRYIIQRPDIQSEFAGYLNRMIALPPK